MIDYKYKYLKYKKKYLLGAGRNKSRSRSKSNSTNNSSESSKFKLMSYGSTVSYLKKTINAEYFLSLLEICFQNDNEEQFNLENIFYNNWILLMEEKEILGCLSYDFIGDRIEISNVCNFSSKYKGICKYLLSKFLESTDNNIFYLKVKNDNLGAIKCYVDCGFEIKSEEDNIIEMECKKKNITVFDDSIIIERVVL